MAGSAQGRPQGVQWETRVETIVSRSTAIHTAVGANVVLGTYTRFGVLGAAGARSIADEWRPSGRVDLIARFHVDPQRQFGHGLYVLGGASALLDEGVRTRLRAVVGAGIEGKSLGSGWIVGAEGGFGGGGRVALTLRRARRSGR